MLFMLFIHHFNQNPDVRIHESVLISDLEFHTHAIMAKTVF